MKKNLLLLAVAMSTLVLNAQVWQIPVTVLGTYVKSENFRNLAELMGVKSGTVEYDTRDNIFTFTDVVWDRSDATNGATNSLFAIYDGTYTFKFSGSCYFDNAGLQRSIINAEDKVQVIITSDDGADVTIKGGNMMSMKNDAECHLENLSLTGDSVIFGIAGYSSVTPAALLAIDHANLTITAKAHPVCDVKNIDFKGVSIINPYNAMFSLEKKGFVDINDELLTDYVELKIGMSTSVEDMKLENKAHKVCENGAMYIIRNGKRFNILGAEVR